MPEPGRSAPGARGRHRRRPARRGSSARSRRWRWRAPACAGRRRAGPAPRAGRERQAAMQRLEHHVVRRAARASAAATRPISAWPGRKTRTPPVGLGQRRAGRGRRRRPRSAARRGPRDQGRSSQTRLDRPGPALGGDHRRATHQLRHRRRVQRRGHREQRAGRGAAPRGPRAPARGRDRPAGRARGTRRRSRSRCRAARVRLDHPGQDALGHDLDPRAAARSRRGCGSRRAPPSASPRPPPAARRRRARRRGGAPASGCGPRSAALEQMKRNARRLAGAGRRLEHRAAVIAASAAESSGRTGSIGSARRRRGAQSAPRPAPRCRTACASRSARAGATPVAVLAERHLERDTRAGPTCCAPRPRCGNRRPSQISRRRRACAPSRSRDRREPSKTSTEESQTASGAASPRSAKPAETGSSVPRLGRRDRARMLARRHDRDLTGRRPSSPSPSGARRAATSNWPRNATGETLPSMRVPPASDLPSKKKLAAMTDRAAAAPAAAGRGIAVGGAAGGHGHLAGLDPRDVEVERARPGDLRRSPARPLRQGSATRPVDPCSSVEVSCRLRRDDGRQDMPDRAPEAKAHNARRR